MSLKGFVGYLFYDSNMVFWKRQNNGDSKKISGLGKGGQGRAGKDELAEHGGFLRQ